MRLEGQQENRGLAATRNIAFNATACDFVGTIDTDAVPEPGYAKYAMMEYEQADEKLALLGGRLREAFTAEPQDEWRSIHACQDRGENRYYMDTHPPENAAISEEERAFYKNFIGLHFLCGANTVCRRAHVLEVGGYEERLRNNSEDVFVNHALEAAGFHYAFTPHPVAWHQRRDTIVSIMRTTWNYCLNGLDDAHFFSSPHGLVLLLEQRIADAHHHSTCDIELKHLRCVYISYLMMFAHALLDLRYAIAKRGLDPAHALHIQQAFFSRLERLDARSGKPIGKRILNDVGELLLDAETPAAPLPEADEKDLAEVLSAYDEYIDGYPPMLYELLMR